MNPKKSKKKESIIMRIIKRVLSFCIVLFMLSFSAFAETDPDTFLVPFFVGYVVNFGGDITAADAREVLLKSAGLVEWPESVIIRDRDLYTVADADFDGLITAKDARIILRVSAGLDMFDIKLKPGETFIFGYIENLMTSHIDYETSSDKLKVERQIVYPSEYAPPGYIGATDRHTFYVTPSEPGVYVFKVVRYGYVNEPANTNEFRITVAA